MSVVFMCPHTDVSGGTKVIFLFARELKRRGVPTAIAAYRIFDSRLGWVVGGMSGIPVVETRDHKHPLLRRASCIVNFADGITFPELSNKKQILLLQGFGTQHLPTEDSNLKFKYSAVIATSKWLEQLALQYGHKDVSIVHPGVDAIFSPRALSKESVTYIGGLYHKSPTKNFSRYAAVICMLRRKLGFNVKASVLSSYVDPDFSIFKSNQVPHQVTVLPSQKQLPNFYSQCTVWIASSTNEGWGLTTLESMACGTPVVYIPSKGLDEYMVDGANCLIASDSTEDVAEKVRQLLTDSALKSKLIAGGITTAKRFVWANSVEKFRSILHRVVGPC